MDKSVAVQIYDVDVKYTAEAFMIRMVNSTVNDRAVKETLGVGYSSLVAIEIWSRWNQQHSLSKQGRKI